MCARSPHFDHVLKTVWDVLQKGSGTFRGRSEKTPMSAGAQRRSKSRGVVRGSPYCRPWLKCFTYSDVSTGSSPAGWRGRRQFIQNKSPTPHGDTVHPTAWPTVRLDAATPAVGSTGFWIGLQQPAAGGARARAEHAATKFSMSASGVCALFCGTDMPLHTPDSRPKNRKTRPLHTPKPIGHA